jgi:AraC-like DNA-binding protein
MAPFVRFLDAQGVSTARLLERAGLSYYPFEAPEQAISFLGAVRFVSTAARGIGLVDLGCRVADELALTELGIFGHAVLHSPDLRSALQRAGLLMRHFSSHETLLVDERGGRAVVSFHFSRAADPAELHIAEQYSAMLVRRMIERSGLAGECFQRVVFSSDPFGGLETLRAWFGDQVVASGRPGLHMILREGVLDRPLPQELAPQAATRPAGWLPLGPQLALRESLGLLISTMLLAGAPTIGDVAQVSGMSQRSLQRQLHAEGTSFRDVLDAQRRELALRFVRQSSISLSGLSQNLGYGHQSSLTRAVKRWTAESPRRLRRGEVVEPA